MMIKYLSDDDELFVSSLPISYYTDADKAFADEDEIFVFYLRFFLVFVFAAKRVICFKFAN